MNWKVRCRYPKDFFQLSELGSSGSWSIKGEASQGMVSVFLWMTQLLLNFEFEKLLAMFVVMLVFFREKIKKMIMIIIYSIIRINIWFVTLVLYLSFFATCLSFLLILSGFRRPVRTCSLWERDCISAWFMMLFKANKKVEKRKKISSKNRKNQNLFSHHCKKSQHMETLFLPFNFFSLSSKCYHSSNCCQNFLCNSSCSCIYS